MFDVQWKRKERERAVPGFSRDEKAQRLPTALLATLVLQPLPRLLTRHHVTVTRKELKTTRKGTCYLTGTLSSLLLSSTDLLRVLLDNFPPKTFDLAEYNSNKSSRFGITSTSSKHRHRRI